VIGICLWSWVWFNVPEIGQWNQHELFILPSRAKQLPLPVSQTGAENVYDTWHQWRWQTFRLTQWPLLGRTYTDIHKQKNMAPVKTRQTVNDGNMPDQQPQCSSSTNVNIQESDHHSNSTSTSKYSIPQLCVETLYQYCDAVINNLLSKLNFETKLLLDLEKNDNL